MLATAVILFFRFTRGIGAVTNLNQDYPWGIWIGFDVVSGVALAGGAYVITCMVYILHLDKYHAIVACYGIERLSGLRILCRRIAIGLGASVECHQPDHRQLVRRQLRPVSRCLAFRAVHDGPIYRVLAGHSGMVGSGVAFTNCCGRSRSGP